MVDEQVAGANRRELIVRRRGARSGGRATGSQASTFRSGRSSFASSAASARSSVPSTG